MNNLLTKYIKPHRKIILLTMLCMGLASVSTLLFPWIFKDLVDTTLQSKDIKKLGLLSILIIFVFLIRGISLFLESFMLVGFVEKVVLSIRVDLFSHLQNMSLRFFDKKKIGEIISTATSDLTVLQNFWGNNLVTLVTTPLILTVSLAAIFYLNWKLALLSLVTFPFIVLIVNYFGQRIKKTSANIQSKISDIVSTFQEIISQIKIVQIFNRKDYEINKFRSVNEKNYQMLLKRAKVNAMNYPLVEFMASIGMFFVFWYGGILVINNEMTAGSLIAFLLYLLIMFSPLANLSASYLNIQQCIASAERIFAILNMKSEFQKSFGKTDLSDSIGDIRFKDIHFSYNGVKNGVLNNLDFIIHPTDKIAIIGESGAGKTTMINLLLGLYDGYDGEILIDDIDIKKINLNSLREQMGVVLQEPVLFHTTIKENILYGKLDATDGEIVEAAKIANAHKFIMNLPDKYETVVGDRGCRLSVGERQRICIARAIIKNPKILILDEPTSALDIESEREVLEAIERVMNNRTTIIISHRLSAIKNVDRVLVLKEGKITEMQNV